MRELLDPEDDKFHRPQEYEVDIEFDDAIVNVGPRRGLVAAFDELGLRRCHPLERPLAKQVVYDE